MKNILIISGHASLKKHSTANKSILSELSDHFPKAEFVYLDERYPDYKIDVQKEQKQLTNADIIVLQFPINWYHTPSLLSCWFEQTLTYGFAYGVGGDKLKNKKLILSYTTGSPADAYTTTGHQAHSVQDFLLPVIQTVKLCNLELVGHIYTGGMNAGSQDQKSIQLVKNQAHLHALKLIKLIESIK